MMKFAKIAAGVGAVVVVASLIAHRRVIAACVKGEPLPETPKWHKHCSKKKD